MCIAIVNRFNGKEITELEFKNCWNSNGDGFGVGYVSKKKIIANKELFSISKAYSLYKEALYLKDTETDILLHFRIGTGGAINLDNCHPFFVNPNLIFCHNGILDIKPTDTHSDTRLFNVHILSKIDKNFFRKPEYKLLIELAIGRSKFCFLDSMGKSYIFNPELGMEENGNWFSNSSHKSYSYEFNKNYLYYEDYCDMCGQLTNVDNMVDDEYLNSEICLSCYQALNGVTA